MAACYFILLKIYHILLRIVALFHPKAATMLKGRQQSLRQLRALPTPNQDCYWFHFASLGEFEQGRSVMEALHAQEPQTRLVITFYSPSGYEVRKNTPLADLVLYLPADSSAHAQLLIQKLRPKAAFFTKYEYWYGYFREMHREGIPIYMVSAIFRPNQVFFKWYGGFFREMLHYVTHFFVQDQQSVQLLASIGLDKVTQTGDTRFDRVVNLPSTRKTHPLLGYFSADTKVLVAGSTWAGDEKHLSDWLTQSQGWKIILAPHEIHEAHIQECLRLFPQSIRFSVLSLDLDAQQIRLLQEAKVLVVDNIGWLSSLYGQGQIAYIGGGFGVGIHNTLEAATYGIPVLFGPQYHKFKEAKDLIALGAAYSFQTTEQLSRQIEAWTEEISRSAAGQAAQSYVKQQAGATQKILNQIKSW
jgi:3-deoxy-D-manno-octulosonic-acid transferase